jgi:hypothetical protein
MKEKLLSMPIGQGEDIVFSNGILHSTKAIYRNSETEWEVHSFNTGWRTAKMNLDQAINYLEGNDQTEELIWE